MVYRLNGKRQVRTVRLNRGGDGRKKVPFDGRKVAAVSVTLVNASTRYACNKRTYLACAGKPVDDKLRFSVTGRATKSECEQGVERGDALRDQLRHRDRAFAGRHCRPGERPVLRVGPPRAYDVALALRQPSAATTRSVLPSRTDSITSLTRGSATPWPCTSAR